ncbi:hypothetical protein WICPIJ_001116 [Wickerhamomyces pijperi]|uniref:Replication protein A C-terminal domain-containing protein n=1 Tax=Wickerhamomyces pijperi TaxID=599730 RepID=A0A9P8QEH8_WICPI|nr:hypothetical protein WICPIJ_001116 [Wickerhamomyces pijperi]
MATYSDNYNQTSYGGENNYTSGGGFDDNNTSSSQAARTQTKSSFTPVTIKQILDSTQSVQEGEFTSHGLELNMVSCVGVIRTLTEVSTRLQASVEDGTGTITLTLWPKGNDENSYKFLTEGEYYYFSGSVSDFSGKRTLQHCVARPIEDHNEIIYHHLSAIDIFLSSNAAGASGLANQLHQGNSLFVQESSNANSNVNSNDSSAPLIDRIYGIISDYTPTMPEGVQISYIATTLGVPVEKVSEECIKLSEDAKIYFGFDENGLMSIFPVSLVGLTTLDPNKRIMKLRELFKYLKFLMILLFWYSFLLITSLLILALLMAWLGLRRYKMNSLFGSRKLTSSLCSSLFTKWSSSNGRNLELMNPLKKSIVRSFRINKFDPWMKSKKGSKMYFMFITLAGKTRVCFKNLVSSMYGESILARLFELTKPGNKFVRTVFNFSEFSLFDQSLSSSKEATFFFNVGWRVSLMTMIDLTAWKKKRIFLKKFQNSSDTRTKSADEGKASLAPLAVPLLLLLLVMLVFRDLINFGYFNFKSSTTLLINRAISLLTLCVVISNASCNFPDWWISLSSFKIWWKGLESSSNLM